jgi:hypothetical protein
MSMFLGSPVRAADDAVASYIQPNTDVIVHVDMSAVKFDSIIALYQKAQSESALSQTEKDKAAEVQKQLVVAKMWVAGFTQAGGKDIYAVVSITGMMTQKYGELVVPLAPGADPVALAKLLNPTGNPGGNPAPAANGAAPAATAAVTAVIGNNLILCTPGELPALQASQNAPAQIAHSDLLDALSAGGPGAVHIAVSGSGIQFATGMLGPILGIQPSPQMGSLTWTTLALSLPPAESFSLTINCKTPESAAALTTMINSKIDAMRNDPQTAANLGDKATQFADALKPKIDGTKITISLDQTTLDSVMPALMKKAQANNPIAPVRRPVPAQQGGSNAPIN